MTNLTLNSIRRFVNNGRVLRIAGTLLAALIISSCEEYPTPYEPGLYPRAAPAGWWDDEGASGKPRIVVHVGEQKAYFYKGKTLVGETTVSTGKPGFSTRKGPISMARGCRMPCFSEAVMRCIRATSRHLPRPTVASVCRERWPLDFSRMLLSELR